MPGEIPQFTGAETEILPPPEHVDDLSENLVTGKDPQEVHQERTQALINELQEARGTEIKVKKTFQVEEIERADGSKSVIWDGEEKRADGFDGDSHQHMKNRGFMAYKEFNSGSVYEGTIVNEFGERITKYTLIEFEDALAQDDIGEFDTTPETYDGGTHSAANTPLEMNEGLETATQPQVERPWFIEYMLNDQDLSQFIDQGEPTREIAAPVGTESVLENASVAQEVDASEKTSLDEIQKHTEPIIISTPIFEVSEFKTEDKNISNLDTLAAQIEQDRSAKKQNLETFSRPDEEKSAEPIIKLIKEGIRILTTEPLLTQLSSQSGEGEQSFTKPEDEIEVMVNEGAVRNDKTPLRLPLSGENHELTEATSAENQSSIEQASVVKEEPANKSFPLPRPAKLESEVGTRGEGVLHPRNEVNITVTRAEIAHLPLVEAPVVINVRPAIESHAGIEQAPRELPLAEFFVDQSPFIKQMETLITIPAEHAEIILAGEVAPDGRVLDATVFAKDGGVVRYEFHAAPELQQPLSEPAVRETFGAYEWVAPESEELTGSTASPIEIIIGGEEEAPTKKGERAQQVDLISENRLRERTADAARILTFETERAQPWPQPLIQNSDDIDDEPSVTFDPARASERRRAA